jgi:hypothetical protein
MSCAPIRVMSPSPYTPAGQVAADHEGQATEDRPLTDPGDIRRQERTRSASSSSNAMPWIVEPGHASRRVRAAGRAQGRRQLRRCHHRRGSREKSLDAARTESNARTCHRTWSLTAQRTLTEPPNGRRSWLLSRCQCCARIGHSVQRSLAWAAGAGSRRRSCNRCESPNQQLGADISDMRFVRYRLQVLSHRVILQKAVHRKA